MSEGVGTVLAARWQRLFLLACAVSLMSPVPSQGLSTSVERRECPFPTPHVLQLPLFFQQQNFCIVI